MSRSDEVWIVGAGWAGLAAAIGLDAAGFRVGLIEQNRHVGGRARAANFRGLAVDNGQHLLIGAYRAIEQTLQLADVAPDRLFRREPLRIECRDHGEVAWRIEIPRSASRWQRLRGFLDAPVAPRVGSLTLLRSVLSTMLAPRRDITVSQWLSGRAHSTWLSRAIWEPLCLAIMNTPARQASAQVFARSLRETFAGPDGASDLMLPTGNLDQCFARPILEALRRSGRHRLLLGQRVQRLRPVARGVEIDLGESRIEAARVVVATSWHRSAELLGTIDATRDLAAALARWQVNPITTLYLGFDSPVGLDYPVTGLLDGPVEWLIDRRHCGQAQVLAAVVSADSSSESSAATRYDSMLRHIRQHRPDLPQPAWHKLVREKAATFACSPEIQTDRPGCASAQPGLWLAGDFTDTGLPATLEGAVRSGRAAADAIVAEST